MVLGGCDCVREACRGVWEGRAGWWRAPPLFCASSLGAGFTYRALDLSWFEGADGLAVCAGFAADGVFDPGG